MDKINKRKICVITGTRADYGLLHRIMAQVRSNGNELQIVATGSHIEDDYGYTITEIENDGFFINDQVNINLVSDTTIGITKSISIAIEAFSHVFKKLKPDIILILGDRYEIFASAIASTIARIPIAHIHGGETTEGVIDEALRHSITKMSHLHFTSTDVYRTRVIQLGEDPQRVFNVGAPGIDNIRYLKLLDKEELENSIGCRLGRKNMLVTFHPVTLDHRSSHIQFQELINALDTFEDTFFIFTSPNADSDSRVIMSMIESYVTNNKNRACSFQSLGYLKYLSCLQFIDLVIGNSSSGIIEVPSFNIPTVNIGDRQRGRIMATSIINCKPEKDSIITAIKKAYSDEFKNSLNNIHNPYEKKSTAKEIAKILTSFPIEGVIKKSFYDIDFKQ